jgi:hypothetical protein
MQTTRPHFLTEFLKLLLVILGLAVLFVSIITGATSASSTTPAWVTPSVMAIKRVSARPTQQHQPNALPNLDCTLLTYRTTIDSTMQTGCFTPTAFGMMDSGKNLVIFNGTDEALAMSPNIPGQTFAPWPNALNLISLVTTATDGSYLSMYTNPLAVLKDHRNILGQLTSKDLTAPPDLPLTDATGQRIIVYPQQLGYLGCHTVCASL